MEGLGRFLKDKRKPRQPQPVQRGGINSLSTELRANTAKLLGVSIGEVAGLTRGFRNDQLKRLLDFANDGKNPPALWWWHYKQHVKLYGRGNKKVPQRERKERGKKDIRDPRQGTLFKTSEGEEAS